MACSANSAARTPANSGRCQTPFGCLPAAASPLTNESTSCNSTRYQTLRLAFWTSRLDLAPRPSLQFRALAAFCSLTLVAAVRAESRSRRAWSKTESPFAVCAFRSPWLKLRSEPSHRACCRLSVAAMEGAEASTTQNVFCTFAPVWGVNVVDCWSEGCAVKLCAMLRNKTK